MKRLVAHLRVFIEQLFLCFTVSAHVDAMGDIENEGLQHGSDAKDNHDAKERIVLVAIKNKANNRHRKTRRREYQ